MALQPAPPELRQVLGGAYKWLVQLLRSLTTIQSQANSALAISGLTIQNNTPSGGKISWSASTVFYQGVAYPIAAGSTAASELYVTWTVGASTFTPTNSFVPGPTLFVILTNNAGTADITWDKVGAQSVTTSQLANQAVTAGKIANATITNAQIANATILAANIFSVDAGTISTGTLTAINITSVTISAATISASSFTATTGGGDIITINASSNTIHVANGSNSSDIKSGGISVTNASGHTNVLGQSFAIVTGATQTTLAPTTLTIGGIQVLTSQQTGPGNPSFAVLADAQTWCQNLLNALRTHGLVT